MKKFFTDLKQKLGTVATEQLESHRPGTLSELDAMGRRAAQHTAVLRQALSDRATDAKAMAQRVAGDEHVRQAVDRISAGFDSVRNGVAATASSVASSIATASASKAKGAGPAGGPTDERGKLSAAIKKLRARDGRRVCGSPRNRGRRCGRRCRSRHCRQRCRCLDSVGFERTRLGLRRDLRRHYAGGLGSWICRTGRRRWLRLDQIGAIWCTAGPVAARNRRTPCPQTGVAEPRRRNEDATDRAHPTRHRCPSSRPHHGCPGPTHGRSRGAWIP